MTIQAINARRPRSLAVLAMGVAIAASACRSGPPPLPSEIKDTARIAYYEGVARLAAGDYTKATEIFQALSGAPRHVRHALLAKLRLADAMFYQGRYAEATEMYRAFANQHRSDPNLAYARFRVAESYFKRLPSEWFLSAPAHEMDQTLSQQAEAELTGFLSLFPTSTFAPEARRMLADTRRMLFRHELYAADFYEARGAWQGVVWRLRDARERFPELTRNEAHDWRVIEAQDKVGKHAETMAALVAFVETWPESRRKADAVRRVGELKARIEAEKAKADAAPAVDGGEPLPEKLDAPPRFRLNLPGGDVSEDPSPPSEDDADDEELLEDDETEDEEDGDVEDPPRLRPLTLPRLTP